MLRHMVLNTLRSNRMKFGGKYGDLIIASDAQNNWRKEIFPYYKASRAKNRDARNGGVLNWPKIFGIMDTLKAELKEFFPYPMIQVEGAEADDIIGYLVRLQGKHLILSGDRDYCQLHHYNIEQYDPVRKKRVETAAPTLDLIEKIIRGDPGDGIPNILSPDDSFVQGKRQTPIYKAFVEKLQSESVDGDGRPRTPLLEGETLRNYKRNETLIDLTFTPESIIEKIHQEFKSQQGKTRQKLLAYFIDKELINLMAALQEF